MTYFAWLLPKYSLRTIQDPRFEVLWGRCFTLEPVLGVFNMYGTDFSTHPWKQHDGKAAESLQSTIWLIVRSDRPFVWARPKPWDNLGIADPNELKT